MQAISGVQGWTEGCLSTANMALERLHVLFNKHINPIIPVPPHPQWFRYDGLPVDVSGRWLNSHPGGRAALENHFGEDIDRLWNLVHGSRDTRRHMFALIANTLYR